MADIQDLEWLNLLHESRITIKNFNIFITKKNDYYIQEHFLIREAPFTCESKRVQKTIILTFFKDFLISLKASSYTSNLRKYDEHAIV